MEKQAALRSHLAEISEIEKQKIFNKILWKIMPILFLAYMFSFLDRVNIGYAKLQMQDYLGFTDIQYAYAAGIFFIGYALFEIPSNLLMDKIGARKTLARIMILWGLASAATMYVSSINQFYIIRFLLGIFEAGFYPGVFLYFSYWFPGYLRGRVAAIILAGSLVAPIIGGPISGLIMTEMNGFMGMFGWQWMFLLEALPIIFIGIFCFFYLSDKPQTAKWLNAREKQVHQHIMNGDNANKADAKEKQSAHSMGEVFKALGDPRVYLLAFLAFATYCGNYGFSFWLPTMIKDMGVTNIAHISYYSVIPFSLGALGLYLITRSSDKRRERRWHYALSMILASSMLVIASYVDVGLVPRLILLGFASFGFMGGMALAWTLPAGYLQGSTAPVGIALVSTLATTAGYFSPWLMGVMRENFGTNQAALVSIAAVMFLASLLMMFVVPAKAVYVSEK
ncbi:MFS transporter [Acinetobacter sp. ANC 3813]|uniref:MFS transporter n=1 Tax=Acinetobacter sp. ANC 3813 TaxID=1977873 RepID=UPI000A338562|nr:MFS transporter [Acinetobacter sp. ANC 3813]OTG91339.1 MFS transporter [Acinetobacter sp. ANC 3813]